MDLLCHQDILIDEHNCIGIIEVPIVGTIRVMCAIGLSNVAKDVASDLIKFEHAFYAPFPDVLVSVIQGFPSLSNCYALTNGDLSDQWHHSNDVWVCKCLCAYAR